MGDDDVLNIDAEIVHRLQHLYAALRIEDTDADQLINEVRKLRAEIGDNLDKITERATRDHVEAWTKWLRTGIDQGAKNAHRYLKIPQPWRPQPLVDPDGILTADPERMTEAYRAKYVKRWNNGEDTAAADVRRKQSPWATTARCALPMPLPTDIREASRAFPHTTAVAYDGMAMRHYDMLTDDALRVLGNIILTMEYIARVPPPSWKPLLCPS